MANAAERRMVKRFMNEVGWLRTSKSNMNLPTTICNQPAHRLRCNMSDPDPNQVKKQTAPPIPQPADDGFPPDKDVSIDPPNSDKAAKDRDHLTSYGEAAGNRDPDERK
jgi:hypothetical protein